MGAIGTARGLARDLVGYAAVSLGWRHSEARLAEDARVFWTQADDDNWHNQSHWQDGSVFVDHDWAAVGQGHWRMFDRLARSTPDYPRTFRRIVEWGCGGGANAVAFAPRADVEFVGVDIDQRSLDECERQVTGSTATPFAGVLADAIHPEETARTLAECDLWLSMYVLELVPSPDYGLRLMRIAYDMLTPGGLAFVQIKYDTGSWRTRSRLRSYRRSTASTMTTYRIDEFWTAMEEIGFTPEAVELVPHNELDERYAYFLLSKGLRQRV